MVLARGLNERHDHGNISIPCPYGEPGDRLWVRETWALVQWLKDWETGITDDVRDWTKPIPKTAMGGGWGPVHQATYGGDVDTVEERGFRWRPSIHMPRWASRVALEVTEVRVQRLQEISEEDARAEGAPSWPGVSALAGTYGTNHRANFIDLWDSINGERPGRSWEANPWVWCVSFRRAS